MKKKETEASTFEVVVLYHFEGSTTVKQTYSSKKQEGADVVPRNHRNHLRWRHPDSTQRKASCASKSKTFFYSMKFLLRSRTSHRGQSELQTVASGEGKKQRDGRDAR